MGKVPSPISAVRGDPKTALAPQFWGTLRIGSPQSWGVRGAKSYLYSATPKISDAPSEMEMIGICKHLNPIFVFFVFFLFFFCCFPGFSLSIESNNRIVF